MATTNDAVGQYLDRAAAVEVPTPQEQTDLAKRIHAGRAARTMLSDPGIAPRCRATLRRVSRDGEAARRRMIEGNLRLVVAWVSRYRRSGTDLADLIQDGNVGLIRAVDRFDPARGYRFATYATWWIRQAVVTSTSGTGATVPLPGHVQGEISKLRKAEANLTQSTGVDPDDRALAAYLDWRPEVVDQLRRAVRPPVSLDATVSDDGSARLVDVVADPTDQDPEDRVIDVMFPVAVAGLVATLPAMQREVLTLRFGFDGRDPRTLRDVGRHIGVSRERVRQISEQAFAALAPLIS